MGHLSPCRRALSGCGSRARSGAGLDFIDLPPLTPQPQLVAHRGVVMRQLSVPVTVSPRSLTRLGASPGKMEKSCLARSKCRYFTPADNTGVSWTSAPTPALQPAMD